MIRTKYTLTDEHKRICQRYVDNDLDIDKTAKQVALKPQALKLILDRKCCKTFIEYRAQDRERKSKLDYNYKMYKLRKVVDAFIPDDAELISKDVSVALSAIAEANKMQGHYSAEKHVNLNINTDVDLQKVKDEAKQMLIEYKKEY